jgi:hypothetical protein
MKRTYRDADGYRRGAMGIDGDKGGNFTKQYAVSPWDSNPKGNFMSPRGAGAYQDADTSFLRNREDFGYRAKTRSLASLLDDAGEVNNGYSGKLPNVDMDN